MSDVPVPPSSWPRVSLGEVCVLQNGFAFDGSRFSRSSGFPLIRIRDLKTNMPSERFDGDFDRSYVVTPGDLLVGMDGEFRCYQWSGPPALLNQRTCRLLPQSDRLDASYLRFVIDRYLREIEDTTGFTTVKHISSRQIVAISLPLPPLAEQRRIAARLTEQLATVEWARKAAEERVTAARECVPSYVRAFLERGEVWPRVRLADLIEDTRNGLYKPDEYYGDGTPILKMFNIGRLDGSWDLRRVDHVRVSESEFVAFRLAEGDILVNRVNSRELVGKCAVVDAQVSGAVFESKNVRLRLRKGKANSVFAATILNSPVGRDQFARSLKQIVGMATISRPDLDAVVLPSPPLAEQDLIAADLTVLRSIAARLAAGAEAELAAIDALPAALLREEFGEAL